MTGEPTTVARRNDAPLPVLALYALLLVGVAGLLLAAWACRRRRATESFRARHG